MIVNKWWPPTIEAHDSVGGKGILVTGLCITTSHNGQ